MSSETKTTQAPVLEFAHTFTVGEKKADSANSTTHMLLKDGQPVICHKIPPSVIPPTIVGNQHQIVPCLCTLNCGKANILLDRSVSPVLAYWQQGCDIMNIKFPLDTKEETQQPPKA